jgi:hypothetical protein
MKTKNTTQKTKLMSNTDVYRDREPARTDNSVWEIVFTLEQHRRLQREPTRTDNSVWEIGATQTPQKEVIYVRYVFTLEQHRPHRVIYVRYVFTLVQHIHHKKR